MADSRPAKYHGKPGEEAPSDGIVVPLICLARLLARLAVREGTARAAELSRPVPATRRCDHNAAIEQEDPA